MHWKRGCPLGMSGHPSRLVELDRDHPALRALAEASPAVVLANVAIAADARLCELCIPEPVLAELGIEKPDGARAGVPLRR